MIQVYAILIVSTLLAFFVRRGTFFVERRGILEARASQSSALVLLLLMWILIWFAGLRTVMNDTGTYISSFQYKIPGTLAGLSEVEWSIGANPLFHVYQILLKTLVSSNGQVFIFCTSLITIYSMVRFLHRFSPDFGLSMYLFIAFTVYAFTMAAMKQTLGTAIAIWAIPSFVRRRPIKAFIILFFAMLIHPYVIVFASAFFLVDRGVWNKRVYLVIAATFVFGVVFSSAMGLVLEATADIIGDEYNIANFAEGTGVSILRVASHFIIPGLAFLSRKEMNREQNSFQDLCINLSIIGMCFSILSGFGGAVLFGRLPNYFDPFVCIAFPYTIHSGKMSIRRMKSFLIPALMFAFFIFYYTYYRKYFSLFANPLTADIYHRTTLLALFKRAG